MNPNNLIICLIHLPLTNNPKMDNKPFVFPIIISRTMESANIIIHNTNKHNGLYRNYIIATLSIQQDDFLHSPLKYKCDCVIINA